MRIFFLIESKRGVMGMTCNTAVLACSVTYNIRVNNNHAFASRAHCTITSKVSAHGIQHDANNGGFVQGI